MAQDYLPTGIGDPTTMIWTISIIMTLVFVFGAIWFIYNWISE